MKQRSFSTFPLFLRDLSLKIAQASGLGKRSVRGPEIFSFSVHVGTWTREFACYQSKFPMWMLFWLVTQSRGVVCGCVARVASGSVDLRAYPSHHRELVEVTKCTRISVGHIIVKILWFISTCKLKIDINLPQLYQFYFVVPAAQKKDEFGRFKLLFLT